MKVWHLTQLRPGTFVCLVGIPTQIFGFLIFQSIQAFARREGFCVVRREGPPFQNMVQWPAVLCSI